MLVFLTGFCAGLAFGWFSYAHQKALLAGLAAYGFTAFILIRTSVLLPVATGAGAMNLSLLEFVDVILDHYLGNVWAVTLSWMVLGTLVARIVTWFAYEGFTQETIEESREDRRRKVRADMKYSDIYFD